MAKTFTNGKFVDQTNLGWTFSFEANGAYPIIANRIFETLAAAQGFLNNPTCIPGLILRVIKDTAENNGVYWVGYADESQTSLKLNKIGEGQGGQENVIEHVFVKTDDEPVELEVTDKGVTIDLTDYVTESELDSKLVDKFVQSTRIVEGFIDQDGNFHEKEADPVTKKMLPYLEIVVNKEDGDVTDGKVFYIDLSRFTDTYYGEDAKDTEAVNDTYSPNIPSITIDSNNHIHVSREWIAGYIKDLATNESVTNAINNFKRDVVDPLTGLVNNKADQSDLEALEERVETLEQQTCPVQDVQVNGTSVVDENGIANIIIGDFATKEELEEVEGKIPTREDIEGIAGPLTDQKIDATVGVQYEPDESRRILTVKNGEKTITIRNAAEKEKTGQGTLWAASNDDTTLYYLQVENVLYPSNEAGERLEPAVGEDLSISAETKTEATGLYGDMQGNTRVTIAQLAAEVKQLAGGEAVGIKYIDGENATWEGKAEYVNIKASEPIDNAVSLTSKVKTANAAVDMDGNISYEDGLMTSKDFEIMTGWTVLN